MPLHETQNDANDVVPDSAAGDNYWGYSTLSYFAPDRRYACDRSPGGPTRELRAMVEAYHAVGIKVFVDVVYNHTAEGGGSSLLSLRGLDNATYYQLAADATRFQDNTGIGASTNARSALFRDLVIDSLRYWQVGLGVDGFRFDLAPILGNGCDRGCFRFDRDDGNGVLRRAVRELPARGEAGGAGVDLIAEPWGIGAGTCAKPRRSAHKRQAKRELYGTPRKRTTAPNTPDRASGPASLRSTRLIQWTRS